MNERKLEPSKSLQNSASLEIFSSSNIPATMLNHRSSFFKGNQNFTIDFTGNPNKNKKSKYKQKIKRANGNRDKMLKDGPQKVPQRKRRSVPYIPQTIKFRSQSKTRISCAFSKASHDRKLFKDHCFKNQNQTVAGHSLMGTSKYANNEELQKSSLKPNRLNFMSRVSNIFDLFTANTNLPKFVQSFLNKAFLVLRKNSFTKLGNKQNSCIQKYDEFKKICEGIYESSEEEDLKHFMKLSLPSMSRWIPKSAHNRKAARQPEASNSANPNEGSVLRLKAQKKQETHASKPEKENINLIDKLNSKLEQYMKNFQDPTIQIDKFEEFRQFPKKQNNNGLRWRNRRSLKEVI